MNDLLTNLAEINEQPKLSSDIPEIAISSNTIKLAHSIEWRFATNHINLLMMLAMGVISEPTTFGRRYAQDSLSIHTGYVPLFAKPVPKAVLNYNLEQHPDLLKPCILSINKKSLADWLALKANTIRVPAWIGQAWQWLDIQQDDFSQVSCVLLPTPLPLGLVDKILFQHKDELKAYQDRLQDTNNVIQNLPTTVATGEFKSNKKMDLISIENLKKPLPPLTIHLNPAPNQVTPANVSIEPLSAENNTQENELLENASAVIPKRAFANSVGAVLTYLSWLANVNEKASVLFQAIIHQSVANLDDALLQDIGFWLMQSGNYHSQSVTNESFLQLMTAIITHRNSGQFASPKDIILYQLREIAQRSDASTDFITDLSNLVSFSNETVTSLLGRHTRPLARSVILFFSQPDVMSLWHANQSSQIKGHTTLDNTTLLLASLLFAVADGWLSLSTELKTYANNDVAISNIMAQLAHNLSLTQPTPYLNQLNRPLLNILQEEKWTKQHDSLAIALAKHYEWQCVSTKIVLPEGAVLSTAGKKVCVSFDGNDYKLETVVDKAMLLANLTQLAILPFEVEKALRVAFDKR